jgi:hypothetical protein
MTFAPSVRIETLLTRRASRQGCGHSSTNGLRKKRTFLPDKPARGRMPSGPQCEVIISADDRQFVGAR